MKPSEILRKAARTVEREPMELGCCAILAIQPFAASEEESDAFHWFDLIKPLRPRGAEDPWWGGWGTYPEPRNHNARIIGLCLAAAIAESEGQ